MSDPGLVAADKPLESLVSSLLDGTVQVVDLTRVLSADTPTIELPEPEVSPPPFRLTELSRYDERGPDHYWNAFTVGEHVGTHMDAPIHWVSARQGLDIAAVPAAHLIGPAIVFDREREAAEDPDYLLEVEDVEAFEREHGALPDGAWLLLRTGWDRRWRDPMAFFDRDDSGRAHWPGVSPRCARYLAARPGVRGLGVETVGTDAGTSWSMEPQHPFHHYMLAAGKYGLANLANLDRVPLTGAVLIVAPLRIEGGSGSPARVLALVS